MNRSLNLPPAVRKASPAALVATFGGVGLLRPAPGTWGSAAALLPAAALIHFGGAPLLAAAIVLVFLLGWWACRDVGRQGGVSDPPGVVIDEVAGQWIALLPAGADPVLFGAAFLAFRTFDILKPYPCNWIDRKMKNGLGAMLDDMAAGVYAAILVAMCGWILP